MIRSAAAFLCFASAVTQAQVPVKKISPDLPPTVRAGAASVVITPDLKRFSPVYLAGFGQNRVATGVHDDLYARCFSLQLSGQPPYRGPGSADPGPGRPRLVGRPLVMCGVDSIGLFFDDVKKIRTKVQEQAGPSDVVVAALHDHESPDTMGLWGPQMGKSGINEDYNAFVVDSVVEAAIGAIRKARPARLAFGKVMTPELDTLIHDTRPPEVHDAEIVVMSAIGEDGTRIGSLLNWANHPEALADKNTLLTSDYSGYFRSTFETKAGGIAVFINGAVGGMQSPLGATPKDPLTGKTPPKNTYEFAELVGRRAGELAAEAIAGAKPARVTRLEFHEQTVEIPVTNAGYLMAAKANLFKGRKQFSESGGTSTPVGFIRLSDGSKPVLEIATIPGELYPELSVGGIERYEGADFPDAPLEKPVKSMLTAPYKMLFGLANDEIGYIIPKAEWDEKEPWLKGAAKRWYGEVNSIGPEAAPRIVKALEELIGK